MTLRPEYSLGHSAYNDFLFGTLGQDAAGTEITVLSALSRLGLDPWQESARLAALPRDEAASALAATIARLPDGTWPEAEAAKIAARLVAASALARRESRGGHYRSDFKKSGDALRTFVTWDQIEPSSLKFAAE